MYILITCKFKQDRINVNKKNKTWRHRLFRHSRAAYSVDSGGIYSVDSGGIWLKFKLIQALMYVLVTGKYDKALIKNSLSSPALATCETSQVLLAGVSGGFPGVHPFRPTYRLARLDMSEIILKGTLNRIKIIIIIKV